MTADKIIPEIQVILSRYVPDQAVISDDSLLEELLLDSLAVVEFIAEVEDHYDILLHCAEWMNFRSVEDVALAVSARIRPVPHAA